ncbi:MAG: GrpB family protein [Blastocatellia bacterium]|nr:GrpB family protein [Blastocatellia bacterium]
MQGLVVPHNPEWRDAFETEAKLIADALGLNVVAIHHIGSTAIPNIYAKPVIDVLVEVRDINEVCGQDPAMKSLGYEVMGEFGIPGRRYFRKDDTAGMRTHQIHVFESGSPHVARHLAFREYLTAHTDTALEYSDLKRRLAAEHPEDPDSYMDGKDEFIKDIDRRAELWRKPRLLSDLG